MCLVSKAKTLHYKAYFSPASEMLVKIIGTAAGYQLGPIAVKGTNFFLAEIPPILYKRKFYQDTRSPVLIALKTVDFRRRIGPLQFTLPNYIHCSIKAKFFKSISLKRLLFFPSSIISTEQRALPQSDSILLLSSPQCAKHVF